MYRDYQKRGLKRSKGLHKDITVTFQCNLRILVSVKNYLICTRSACLQDCTKHLFTVHTASKLTAIVAINQFSKLDHILVHNKVHLFKTVTFQCNLRILVSVINYLICTRSACLQDCTKHFFTVHTASKLTAIVAINQFSKLDHILVHNKVHLFKI